MPNTQLINGDHCDRGRSVDQRYGQLGEGGVWPTPAWPSQPAWWLVPGPHAGIDPITGEEICLVESTTDRAGVIERTIRPALGDEPVERIGVKELEELYARPASVSPSMPKWSTRG